MLKQIALFLFLQLAVVGAVSLLEPIQAEVSNVPVYLGVVGPGQTIELKFARDTGLAPAINPESTKNALWDRALVSSAGLPDGWTSRDSQKYETPLTVFVTVNPNTTRGNYTFTVEFVDEYEGTPKQAAAFSVSVDPQVFEFSLDKETVEAGVGQPAVFLLRATSKSIASDTFKISTSGLPYDWQFSKTFFLPYGQSKEVYFEVVGNIQKEVPFHIAVTSLSSDKLSSVLNARVVTTSDLIQDAKAASRGLPLFPSVEQHIYALFGLVANLFVK